MTTNGLGETFSTEITTGDEITYAATRDAIALLRDANPHADRFGARPLILQWEMAGNLESV